jgi:hypothetical protein
VEHRIDSKDMTMLMPVLTPHGMLTLRRDEEAPELESAQGGARYVTAPPATPSMPMAAGLGYTTRRQ